MLGLHQEYLTEELGPDGHPLSFSQDTLVMRGAALEARV